MYVPVGCVVVRNSTIFVFLKLIVSPLLLQYCWSRLTIRWSSAGVEATRATSSAYCQTPAYSSHIGVDMVTPRVPPGAVRKYSLILLTAKLNKRGDNLDPSLRPCGMSKNSSVVMRGWRTRLFMFEYRLLVFIHTFFLYAQVKHACPNHWLEGRREGSFEVYKCYVGWQPFGFPVRQQGHQAIDGFLRPYSGAESALCWGEGYVLV
jgi:hypothetical protein